MILPAPDLAARTTAVFERRHGRTPSLLATAPGRVNVIGEHTDYLGGLCLPLALPYATWVAASPRTDDVVRMSSGDDLAWHGTVDALRTGRSTAPGWQAYVLGALHAVGWRAGIDLHVESSVPVGAGLSSSAALVCAVAVAVSELPPDALLDACVSAEQDYVGAPTGGMDQTVALRAEMGHVLHLDFSSPSGPLAGVVPWRPDEAGLELLVVDTGVRHDNGDGAFAQRRQESEQAWALGPDGARTARDPLPRRRRHVETENTRVLEVVAAAASDDWRRVGALLTASHASLRDDLEVSCAELDLVVEAALAAGAWGARMTGGGFGGCAVALVPASTAPAVCREVTEAAAAAGAPTPTFLRGEASGPARRLAVAGPRGRRRQLT